MEVAHGYVLMACITVFFGRGVQGVRECGTVPRVCCIAPFACVGAVLVACYAVP